MISEEQKDILIQHLTPLKPKKIGVFGSYARGENTAGSDIDVLLHLDYSYPVSLLDIAHASLVLEDALGIPVDIVTEKSLSPLLKPLVEEDLIYIFE
jgi:predicted nucleotidyltransferase